MKPSLTTAITAVAILGIGIIVYIFYDDISEWFTTFQNSSANKTVDANGNQVPTNLMDTLGNLTGVDADDFSDVGGETQGTSETLSGAQSEFFHHPIDTLTSIFSGN